MSDSRLEFELWALSHYGSPTFKLKIDEYVDVDLQIAWEAWQASRQEFDVQKECWRHEAEDLQALHQNLDDAGVPRYENGTELSAWGRALRMDQDSASAGVPKVLEYTPSEAGEQASVPEFLLEMSRQMREQPNRATAHPFWQVRCKRYLPTEQGYNESHYEVCGDEGPVYSSNTPLSGLSEYLLEHHESWCRAWASENHEDDADYTDAVSNWIDPESDLPAELTLVYVQEIEEVVTTHLTQAGAEAFIKRKQHDYPKLYTYVESAYWSPQLRELQDWIIGLTPKQEKGQ